jgi:hypothetical protein
MTRALKLLLLWLAVLLGSYQPMEAAGGATLGVIQTPVSLPSYSTSFPATENPISEGGVWTNGGTTGLDWQNARTTTGTPNKAYGTGFSTGATDNIAILSGFPANQSAQLTVYYASGYTAPGSHEIELLLRFQITAHNARGYEITFRFDGTGVQIVRWNGAVENYTVLTSTGTGISSLATGDVLKATMIGTTITVYKNGSAVQSATDATFSTGNPGMGFFINSGGTLDGYCISQFTAAGL